MNKTIEEFDKVLVECRELNKTKTIVKINHFWVEKLAEQKEKEVEITKNAILMSKSGWIEGAKKDTKEEIQTLLNREIAIAHKEGTPTSRLTSLSVKITKYV